MTQLRTIDAAALAQLSRALIGFDRIFNTIGAQQPSNYPPFNIMRHDATNYEIEIAVAGFSRAEITVEVNQDQLTVRGTSMTTSHPPESYIHRGLAARDFERAFTLPQYMEVVEVTLTNGVLHVTLELIVPETLKPRQIEIK